jgi:alkylation response protein AidB-like acyl-CoA dehydrogenase
MNLADGEGAVALRESVQRMIEREFPLDRVAAWDEKDSISKEEAHQISRLFGDMGFYGLCIPRSSEAQVGRSAR